VKKKSPHHRRHKKHAGHHVLGTKGVIATTVASVLILVGIVGYTRSFIESGQMAAVISSVLVDLTNQDRSHDNLGTLTVNPLLVAAAQAKANDEVRVGCA
jgi:hypothetical protein